MIYYKSLTSDPDLVQFSGSWILDIRLLDGYGIFVQAP